MSVESNKLLTASEVAEILSVNKQTVYRLARQNLIPHIRVGTAVRFSKRKIEQYISSEIIDD